MRRVMRFFPFIGLLMSLSNAVSANMLENLSKQTVVDAGVAEVWRAWTTVEGLRFISSSSKVELKHGGAYEWFLDLPPDEHGRRGGEGAQILVVMPEELLAFTWTFPPAVPSLRHARETTQVVVRFDPISAQRTRVRLDVSGWQDGADWQAGWQYFDQAWERVLQRLTAHFARPSG